MLTQRGDREDTGAQRRRRLRVPLLALTLVLLLAGGVVLYRALLAGPAYTNPVLRNDAPDPSVIRADDGYFYAYTTQSYHGATFVNIPILRSPDLIHWRLVGDALRDRPEWIVPGADNGDLWAPHIARFNGRYYLYYSARGLDSGRMEIGIATSDSPVGPFRDLGKSLVSGYPPFVSIDPFAFQDSDGKKYLYWGSAEAPIYVQRLSEDGLSLLGRPRKALEPRESDNGGLIEGAWILKRARSYYLMYSAGDCCSRRANYQVFVARSSSPMGPFQRAPTNPILAGNADFWAPGHHATIRDSEGNDWMLYHARIRGEASEARFLMLDRIEWERGWPEVNGGEGPSLESDEAPAV